MTRLPLLVQSLVLLSCGCASEERVIEGQPGPTGPAGSADTGDQIVAKINDQATVLIDASRIGPRLGAPEVNVLDYGATIDDTTDDAVAIQNALDAGAGGAVVFPGGVYVVTATLSVSDSGTRLTGAAQSGKWLGAANPGVILRWEGAAGATILQIGDPAAATGAEPYGIVVEHLMLDGNEIAGTGMRVLNGHMLSFHDIYIRDTNTYGLDITGGVSGNPNLVNAVFDTIEVNATNDGVIAGIYSGTNADAGHQTFGSWNNIRVTTKDGTAILVEEMDDVTFSNIGTARVVGGTGRSLDFAGKGNTFVSFHAGMADGPKPEMLFRTAAHGNWALVHGVDDEVAPIIETKAITGAADSGGTISVTCPGHGLTNNAEIEISGVLGATEANGRWVIGKTGEDTFVLRRSTYANPYVSGGTVRPLHAVHYMYTGYQANQGTEHVDLPPIVNPSWISTPVSNPDDRAGVVHDLSRLQTMRTITWPNADGAVVLGDANQTIANKVLAPSNTYRLPSTPPASSSAPGVTGAVTWDSSFVYICVAPNTWRRVAHGTW
ncbi:MAG: hypothetical protein HY903_20520 [Deltaproteobacteria bacterium]|nr:hypothetical protein [Deltaproteobacteria bacterium]